MKWLTAIIAIIVLGLVGLGIAVQASISNVQGMTLNGDPNHFLIQQVIYFVIALVVCVALAYVDPGFWTRKEMVALILAFIVLALLSVHIPGIGKTTKGSARWISLAGLSLQPSEFVKLMAIVLMAWWQGRPGCRNGTFKQGALIPLVALGVIVFGFLSQPDFGSVIMLCAVNIPIMIASGVKIRHIAPFGVLMLIGLVVLILNDPERLSRVTSVFKISSDVVAVADDGDTYQLRQSIAALTVGGLKGSGFGNSIFKQSYLPENHTDFVFAMIGEELGFLVALPCILLFLAMMWLGMIVSLRAPNTYTKLLAFGMTLHIGLSAAVNLGVVTGLLPTKGLALPFLSYGGSSLVSSLVAVGFILSVGWRCLPLPAKPRSYYDRDRKVWIS